MKKQVIFLFLLIAILYLTPLKADSFSIVWGTTQGGVTIGVGGAQETLPPTENVTPPVNPPSNPPGVTPPPGGPSGNLTLGQSLLVIKMKKGEVTQQKLTITNNRQDILSINISILNLSNYIFPTENQFTLNPGESKDLILNIYVSDSVKDNFLTGQIIFQSPFEVKTTDVVLDLQEKAPMFDIKTTLLKKILFPGDKVTANVRVLNLGDLKNVDVELESMIMDSNNTVYDSTKETFAIGDSANKQIYLRLPDKLPVGDYFFSSRVSYQNVSAKSYDSFKILENVVNFGVLAFYMITAIMLTAMALFSAIIRRKIKNNKEIAIENAELVKKLSALKFK
ncbi:MAG TPA: hypothetical protein VMC80_03100 [Patescibacteria group bacterium]|nr:hypothetical protein [Patescibacteria group bacterium]